MIRMLTELTLTDDEPIKDRTTEVKAKLEAVEAKIADAEEKACSDEDASIFYGILRKLSAKKAELMRELESAKSEVASFADLDATSVRTVLQQLDDATDEERGQIRRVAKSKIRLLVKDVLVAIRTGNPMCRICDVTVNLARGGQKKFSIFHAANRKGGAKRPAKNPFGTNPTEPPNDEAADAASS